MNLSVHQSLLIVLLTVLFVSTIAFEKTPEFPLKIDKVAVGGLSAGAFMAVQLHMAHLSKLVGSAILAGGPFYCAQGSLIRAFGPCMTSPFLLNVEDLVHKTRQFAQNGDIDADPDGILMAQQNIYLFSGEIDIIVNQGVMRKLEEYYKDMGAKNIHSKFDLMANHLWPTTDYGNECWSEQSPWISRCNYDASGDIVQHLFSNHTHVSRTQAIPENLFLLDQTPYIPSGSDYNWSMDKEFYAYIPTKCQNNTKCQLFIALHGCKQGRGFIENTFAVHNGLNEWAEGSNIVVLYPQSVAITEFLVENPNGCFDWWGYTGKNYYSKSGPQMKTIQNMVEAISGKKWD